MSDGPSSASAAPCPWLSASVRLWAAWAMACWAASALGADEPSPSPAFRLAPRQSSVRLADRIIVDLVAETGSPAASAILSVDSDVEGGDWHLLSPWGPTAARSDRRQGRLWTATFQSFEVGARPLPPTRIKLKATDGQEQTIELEPPVVEIRSVLAADPAAPEELAGLRPIYRLRRPGWPVAVSVAGAVAAAAAAYLFYRRFGRRRALAPAVEPEPPPEVWALREIARRRRLAVCSEGPPREIATLASEVIRLYFGRRFGLAAMDMTTAECLGALEGRPLAARTLELIRRFLDQCDLWKFSEWEPPRGAWEGLWETAADVVEECAPVWVLDPAAAGERPRPASGAPVG